MDLTKAYDLINHAIAKKGLELQGVSKYIVTLCTQVWKGPRSCHVEGELTKTPVRPKRSLPQGESMAPGAMVSTLVPWQPTSIDRWAFMDDRSLVASGPNAHANHTAALAYTKQFDEKVGNKENEGKRQHWTKHTTDPIEHLGLAVIPGNPNAAILPRGGWERLYTTISRIGSLPGSARVRENLIAAYAKPLWSWPLPLVTFPPDDVAHKIFRAVLRSGCTWWCRGRWWAQRVQLHPLYSGLLTTLKRVADVNLVWSIFVEAAVSRLLDKCGFKHGGFDKSLGICMKLNPDDVSRISQATSKVRQGRLWFWPNVVDAEHAVRACCRIRLLNTSYKSRNDYEGMDRVDIDASSTKPWIDFVKGLNTEEDRRALSIWRGGAIHTQTRRANRSPGDPPLLCVLCDEPNPSARHLWAECAGTQAQRAALSTKYRVPQSWWLNQPRVTSKSGWITLDAAPGPHRRGALQACSCEMGVQLVTTVTQRLLAGQ